MGKITEFQTANPRPSSVLPLLGLSAATRYNPKALPPIGPRWRASRTIVPGAGICSLDADDLLLVGEGTRVVALIFECRPGSSARGLDRDRAVWPVVVLHGVVDIAVNGMGHAPIATGHGAFRIVPHGLVAILHGTIEIPLSQMGSAAVVEGLGAFQSSSSCGSSSWMTRSNCLQQGPARPTASPQPRGSLLQGRASSSRPEVLVGRDVIDPIEHRTLLPERAAATARGVRLGGPRGRAGTAETAQGPGGEDCT